MKPLPDYIVRGEAYKDDVSTPVTLTFNYPTSETEGVNCAVLFDELLNIDQVFIHEESSPEYLQFRAKNGFKQDIWIPRMRVEYPYRKKMDHSIRGIAELYVEGNLDNLPEPCVLKCYVILQNSGLFSFNTIEDFSFNEWSTPFGKAKFVIDYPFEGTVYDLSERNQRKLHMVRLEIDSTKETSLHKLITSLAEYLDDLMWLFSFLSKKYVHWYQIDILSEPDKSKSDDIRFIKIYREPRMVSNNPVIETHPGFENHPSDMLVDIDLIHSNLLQRLVNTYGISTDKHIIKDLIVMVMLTYTRAFIEQNLGIIYTALEKVAREYSESEIINNNQFKKLRKAMENFLDTSESLPDLTSEQLDAIKGKISELQRFSFPKRLEVLFREKLILISEILLEWELSPDNVIEQLKKAVSRRNKYIHGAKIDDYASLMKDIHLIRFLVNVWILSLLDYPLDRINKFDPDLMQI